MPPKGLDNYCGQITIPYNTLNLSTGFGKDYAGRLLVADNTGSVHEIHIKKVIYNNPVTVVFWSDGTKTVTKVHGNDVYSQETGLVFCIAKKLAGASRLHEIIEDWVPEQMSIDGTKTMTFSDVKKNRAKN